MVFSGPHTVPSFILGDIEGGVRFANQFFDRATGLVFGDPKAAGHRNFSAADRNGAGLDSHSKLLCACSSNRERTQREQDQKFFSAVLSNGFVSSQTLPEAIAHVAQDCVTRQVAPGVIHGLEMIQIRHDYAQGFGFFLAADNFAVENFEDSAPVPEAGQAVSHCLVTQLLFC